MGEGLKKPFSTKLKGDNTMAILPKALTAKLLGRKIVNVESSDGEKMEFEIQRVNIELFAGEGNAKFENIAGKTEEEIKTVLLDQFKTNELTKIISPVLLDGLVAPRVVDSKIVNDLEREVPLKVLLVDIALCMSLYTEILQISVKQGK